MKIQINLISNIRWCSETMLPRFWPFLYTYLDDTGKVIPLLKEKIWISLTFFHSHLPRLVNVVYEGCLRSQINLLCCTSQYSQIINYPNQMHELQSYFYFILFHEKKVCRYIKIEKFYNSQSV